MFGWFFELHKLNFFFDVAYPPCTVPLSGLAPIHLRELTLETHHRGRVLVVKCFCEPISASSIQNAVEDELGDVDRLAIHNVVPTTDANTVLPQGAIIAIKDPYYHVCVTSGHTMVYVDHPTDFVLLKPGSSIIPRGLDNLPTKTSRSAILLKEEGNAKFKKQDFQAAAEIYSDALAVCGLNESDDDLRRDLQRNRAAANLRLGRYDLAIKDALDSISSNENKSEAAKIVNIKALHRAGKAAYAMQDFAQARQHFGQALELDGSHKESRNELSRTMERISEQDNGEYDFSLMVQSVTMQHCLLDHASYLRHVKVTPTESRGRGLFATEARKPGEVVFVEKAFHVTHDDGSDMPCLYNLNTDQACRGTFSQRFYSLVNKMLWNPTLAKMYNDLDDGGKFGSEEQGKVVDGRVAVNVFQVQAIAELNGLGCPRVKSRDMEEQMQNKLDHEKSNGIWLQASYMNHSCLSNVTCAFIGDMMVVRAVRDIPAGGEILHGYNSPYVPFAERHQELKENYGFECDCDLCRVEAQVQKVVVDKRTRIRKKIDSFLAEHNLGDRNLFVKTPAQKAIAKKLLAEIRDTYPKALFERLPRLACIEIGLWVARSITGPRSKAILDKFLDVLRDLGFFVNIKGRKVTVDRRAAYHHEIAIHAAIYAAHCVEELGNRSAACALKALAKEIYTAISGAEEGFEQWFLGQ